MGTYLNPNNESFLKLVNSGKYVDKTGLIDLLNHRIDIPDDNFICINRPRRFGKSIAEDMISAYYSKGADSEKLFSPYKIAKTDSFKKCINKFNVLKIDMNACFSFWKAIDSKEKGTFIGYLAEQVGNDFKKQYPDINFGKFNSIGTYIQRVYEETNQTFIIIIDEYDVLVREQVSGEEFDNYLAFLISLFKNSGLKPAIALAYITGILPIIKDKIQAKLNTFKQYTMIDSGIFSGYIGFTSEEVKELCKKYGCSFTECKAWYDGYKLGEYEIYNPEAVMQAVQNKSFKSYWSSTSTYEIISDKLQMNFDGVRDDVITMLSGSKVDVDVGMYHNTMSDFKNKHDVFTFLIHLGYLAYDSQNEQCYIPNREIYQEWQRAICEDNNYSETNKIIEASKQLIKDTIAGNEDAVANALDVSHIHVASNRNYNNEDSLSSAIYLAFIYAINNYTIVKEMTAGKGFADIVYIPFKNNVPAMIVELKHNASPESALNQIKEKRYFDSLSKYSGNLLFVGISYDEKTKKHKCKIERFVK